MGAEKCRKEKQKLLLVSSQFLFIFLPPYFCLIPGFLSRSLRRKDWNERQIYAAPTGLGKFGGAVISINMALLAELPAPGTIPLKTVKNQEKLFFAGSNSLFIFLPPSFCLILSISDFARPTVPL